jgi:hypothetical protein
MSLEFNATIRDKGQANDDKKKILLEVPVKELKGKVEELTGLVNKDVVIRIIPQFYSYTLQFDKSTNAATTEYVVNNDGTIDLIQKEQTQLDVDGQGNIDVEDREFMVTKEVIDEFIVAAKSLEFPGNINPRDAIVRNQNGEPFEEIAEGYEMSEIALINELEKARAYYAPYAAAWDKKRNEVVFQDKKESDSKETADSSEYSDDTDDLASEMNYQSEGNENTVSDELEGNNETEESPENEGNEDPY